MTFIADTKQHLFGKTSKICHWLKHWYITGPLETPSLTNYMSTEIVLKLDIVVLLFSMFIHKHCLEVVTEEARVSRQVKLKMSKVKKEIKIHTHTQIKQFLKSLKT